MEEMETKEGQEYKQEPEHTPEQRTRPREQTQKDRTGSNKIRGGTENH